MNCERFADYRDEIKYEYQINKNYQRSIILLNRLKMRLENESINEKKYPYQGWYVNYDLGYCNNMLSNHEISNKSLFKSLDYTDGEKDPDCGKSNWLIANNYCCMGEIILAKKYYHKAYTCYRSLNKISNKILILMNLAYVNNNMYQLYKIVNAFLSLDEEELLNNTDSYIDKILPSLIEMTYEMKNNNNDLYYKKIMENLNKAKQPTIRKKLLTLSC